MLYTLEEKDCAVLKMKEFAYTRLLARCAGLNKQQLSESESTTILGITVAISGSERCLSSTTFTAGSLH